MELQWGHMVSNRLDSNEIPTCLGHIMDRGSRRLLASLLALHSPPPMPLRSEGWQFTSSSHAAERRLYSLQRWSRFEARQQQWRLVGRPRSSACAVSGIAFAPVKATAVEMTKVYRRPLVLFRVAPSGLVRDVSLLHTSGSPALDQRALAQVAGTRYPPHNCCSCRVSTVIDVDFEGPVWMREPQDLLFRPPSGKLSRLVPEGND